MTQRIPDYETFDYSTVWKGRGIEDRVERTIVSGWASGETGIELGGGFGRITQVLENRVGRMYMVDYSLANLRRASSRLRKTTLVRSSIQKLPFPDDCFDFLALIRVIHHIEDQGDVLSEVVRVCRDGATFVLGIANQNGWPRSRRLKKVKRTHQGDIIFPTPLSNFERRGLGRVEIRGVGIFDNRLGRRLEGLPQLATFDLKTSRLWPAKPMLFVRYRVAKESGQKNEPAVLCRCGGKIAEGRCERCGRSYARIVDLVEP